MSLVKLYKVFVLSFKLSPEVTLFGRDVVSQHMRELNFLFTTVESMYQLMQN